MPALVATVTVPPAGGNAVLLATSRTPGDGEDQVATWLISPPPDPDATVVAGSAKLMAAVVPGAARTVQPMKDTSGAVTKSDVPSPKAMPSTVTGPHWPSGCDTHDGHDVPWPASISKLAPVTGVRLP